MGSRSLKMNDLLAISGYTRNQMRGLLDAMPSYANRSAGERIPNQYSAQDLLVVLTCSQLESRYGLQRQAVVGFSNLLRSVLSGPRPVSASAHLLFTFDPYDVRYVETPEGLAEGLYVPLAPIFQTIDEYLLPSHAQVSWSQRELRFAPQSIDPVPVQEGQDTTTLPESFEKTRRTQ